MVAGAAPRQLLKTGPEQFWILGPDADELAARLQAAIDPGIGVVTPLSHSRTRILVEGAPARDLLAKGIALDLRAEVFRPGQFAQALKNILAILACDGAGPETIARLTCYVVDIDAYRSSLKEIGEAWKAIMGRNYPAMALVAVSALVEPEALIEIEATAVVPE